MENEKFTPTMRGQEQVVPIQEKFLITVPEAAKYFGIGTKQLRRLAENHLSDFAIFMGNPVQFLYFRFPSAPRPSRTMPGHSPSAEEARRPTGKLGFIVSYSPLKGKKSVPKTPASKHIYCILTNNRL